MLSRHGSTLESKLEQWTERLRDGPPFRWEVHLRAGQDDELWYRGHMLHWDSRSGRAFVDLSNTPQPKRTVGDSACKLISLRTFR